MTQSPVAESAVGAAQLAVAAAAPATFTGAPSIVDQVPILGLRIVKLITTTLNLPFSITSLASGLASTSPPFYLTLGLKVQESEFNGWKVVTISSGQPSDEYIVAVHGGSFNVQPTTIHWLDYTLMARGTGANIVVPMYKLTTEGGTAATEVPQMADLVTSLIDVHGADHVSLLGDSAGATMALATAEEIHRRGGTQPKSLVLLTGVGPHLERSGRRGRRRPRTGSRGPPRGRCGVGWRPRCDRPAGEPALRFVGGLPPTYVYGGSAEYGAPNVLALQDKALATPGSNFTFILKRGQIHDWALTGGLDGLLVQGQIYRQLLGS